MLVNAANIVDVRIIEPQIYKDHRSILCKVIMSVVLNLEDCRRFLYKTICYILPRSPSAARILWSAVRAICIIRFLYAIR